MDSLKYRRWALTLLSLMFGGESESLWAAQTVATVDEPRAPRGAAPLLTIACPDIPVQDQWGRDGSFHQVAGGRLTILAFTYGTCRTACPAINGLLAAVYSQLGERVKDEVVLISITVDPEHDGPEQLAAQHRLFGSPPHWHRLTGKRTDLVRLWRVFGVRVGGDPAAHASDIFIGSPTHGSWRRVSAFVSPQDLIRVLDDAKLSMVH